MILNGANKGDGNRLTLDDLFRRAGVRRPEALALVDPPDCERITGRVPLRLTYAQADRAISAFAARLRSFGLQTDTVVAIQLGNTVDSIVALLGVIRAGMIAAPLPLLWRTQEAVNALSPLGAKVVITRSRVGACAQAEVAMNVAAELFPIRYICAFGRELPDGVAPLDDCFGAGPLEFFQAQARPDAADHVAAVTFEVTHDGFLPLARSHNEIIAGGLAAYLEAGIARDATILSTIPVASFAGIALTLVPWLLSGGTLALHHGFDPTSFAEQANSLAPSTLVLPGPALEPLREADMLGGAVKNILGLWRAPEKLGAATPWNGDATLVDIASFGEAGLLPLRRADNGEARPIPLGAITTVHTAADPIAVLETARSMTGTLTLRGLMVPTRPFPPSGNTEADARFAPDGFLDTGYACKVGGDIVALTAPPAGITAVGYYRFRQNEVDAVVAATDAAAVIVALPDALLGQRLAGRAGDAAAVTNSLEGFGVDALIAGAFRPRGIAA